MNTFISELSLVQVLLLLYYLCYTLIRGFWISSEGLRDAIILERDKETIKLYHVLWALVDIPAIILSVVFNWILKLFSFPVFSLEKNKK